MASFSSGPHNSEPAKKHSAQSIFMQCAAIPLFAFIIYTLSKEWAVSLAIVILFYGNAFCMSLVLKILGQGQKIFESILVVNVSLVLLGLLLVTLSMGGYLTDWMQSEKHWNNVLIALCGFYFAVQCIFVRQGMKLNWGWSISVTLLTLLLNGALCYTIFALFFNK